MWANDASYMAVSVAFYGLAVFCNFPHYMATIYRAYGTRADFCKYRFFTAYVTLLMAFTVVFIHWFPQAIPWLFTLYLTWSPWHYTGQNFGIAMMFVRRQGATPSKLDRNLIFYSYVASYWVWFVSMHGQQHDHPYTVSLGIPAGWVDPISMVLLTVFLMCGGIGLVRLSAQIGWRKLMPAVVLHLTQFMWFVATTFLGVFMDKDVPPVYYSAGVLAFMHCAQYLWITVYYAKKETEAGARGRDRKWRPFHYWAVLIVGGLALFIPGPWAISLLFPKQDFVASYLIFTSMVNIHHFILDGAIWKLRDGRIARLLLGKRPDPAEKENQVALQNASVAQWLRRAGDWMFGQTQSAHWMRVSFGVGIIAIGVVDQFQNYLVMSGQRNPERWETAALLNPADSRVHLQRATALHDEGKLEEAITAARAAVAIDPRNHVAQGRLAQLLAKNGEIEEAREIYAEFGDRLNYSYDSLVTQGVIAANDGDFTRASDYFSRALKINEAGEEALIRLAEAQQLGGDAAVSRDRFEEYLQLISWLNAAAAEDPEKAETEAALIAQREREALRVHLQLAESYLAEDGDGEAETRRRAAEHLIAATGLAEEQENWRAFSAASGKLARLAIEEGRIAMAQRYYAGAVMAAIDGGDAYAAGVGWYNFARFFGSLPVEEFGTEAVTCAAAALNAWGLTGEASAEERAAAQKLLDELLEKGIILPGREESKRMLRSIVSDALAATDPG